MEVIKKITAAMQNGLAAIRKAMENANEPTLFATDIQLNQSKLLHYYPAATAGECTPIAYDEAGTATAFFDVLARAAATGQDMTYQPQIVANDGLQGSKVLLFAHTQVTPRNEASTIVRLIPEAMPFDELLASIDTAVEETGAKLVVVDDVTEWTKQSGRPILWDLNELAHYTETLLIAGFMLKDEADEQLSTYLAHAPNLWQLTTHGFNMGSETEPEHEQRYFCLSYGHPDPKRVFYGLDDKANICSNEQGDFCLPRDLVKLLRIKELAQMYAQKSIAQSKFVDICFGALGGEFDKSSIVKAIQTAADNRIIQKTGSGNKTRLLYSDSRMSRTCYNGNVALTCLGNPYTSPKHTKQRKTILKHGEFKLLTPQNGTSQATMQNFVRNLIGTVASGKNWLDFAVKTPYRNVMAIVIGASVKAIDKLADDISALGEDVKFSALIQPNGVTDADFLTAYKQAIDSVKPDFVFIVCYDRISPHLYTEAQLAKELATYSKKKGICTIAASDTEKDREALNMGDEFWSISPLVGDIERDNIDEEYGIRLPAIYSFQGSVDSFDFLCRFAPAGMGTFMKVCASMQDRAFLVGTFYFCQNTDCADIETDVTGEPLTKSVIYRAQKLGLIDVDQYGKTLLDSRITFKGE